MSEEGERKSNVINFPVPADKEDDHAPLFVPISATPDQLLQFCVGRIVRLEASMHALAVCVGGDLTEILKILQRAPIDVEEFMESYRITRRKVIEDVMRDLQEQFPPKESE